MEQSGITKQQTKGTPKALLGMKKKDAQRVREGERKRGRGGLQEGAWTAG